MVIIQIFIALVAFILSFYGEKDSDTNFLLLISLSFGPASVLTSIVLFIAYKKPIFADLLAPI